MRTTPPPARPAISTRSRRLAGALAAVVFGLFAVTPVFAVTPEGTVTVDTDGCDFTVNIALDVPSAVIAWDVKVYASSWWDGATVLQGSVKDDADGKVVAGPYTLPAGHYNVAVDDELVDHSAIVEDFTLSCSEAGASASASASASPSGNDLPAEGTPPPTGQELGAEGAGNVTPPPTDTGMNPGADSGSRPGSLLTFAVISGFATGLFLLSTRRLAHARPRR